MTRHNHKRRRDARAYMAEHGGTVSYAEALRETSPQAQAARRRAAERTLPYEQALGDVARIHDVAEATGLSVREAQELFDQADGHVTVESRGGAGPSVCVVDVRRDRDDLTGVPEHGRIYGYVRPAPRGFVVHQNGWVGEAAREADGLVGPIEIGYVDPETGESRSRQIRPLAACPHDRWLWVETGWALDEPGRIADAHALQPPAPDLLYDVRWCWARDRIVYGQESSYRTEMAHWKLLAWCASPQWAHRIASAVKAFSREGDDDVLAVQVQRPGSAGRDVAATYVPAVHTGPVLPPPVDPADWPAPDPGHEARRPVMVPNRAGKLIPAGELRVHTGEPGSTWQTVCWTLGWTVAERIALHLGVGRPGSAWRFAEAWEFDERPHAQGNQWELRARIPHDHGRLEHDPCAALDEAADVATTA